MVGEMFLLALHSRIFDLICGRQGATMGEAEGVSHFLIGEDGEREASSFQPMSPPLHCQQPEVPSCPCHNSVTQMLAFWGKKSPQELFWGLTMPLREDRSHTCLQRVNLELKRLLGIRQVQHGSGEEPDH